MARPRKPASEKYQTQARQFGRISDEDWAEIKEACEASRQSLVEWGLPTLLAKARREKKQRGKGSDSKQYTVESSGRMEQREADC